MEKIKSFLQSKALGFYFNAGTLLALIVSLVLYITCGITEYTPDFYVSIFVVLGIAIVLAIVTLVFEMKPLREISILLGVFLLVDFIGFEVTYIANVFVSIDGASFSASFIFMMIFFILDIVLPIFSVVFSEKKEKIDDSIGFEVTNG